MTQEVETAVVELDLVSCQTCDLVFVASERRQTCPVCGGEATGPYLEYVLDETGLHPKNGSAILPAGRQAEAAATDTPAGPIADAEAAEEPPTTAADVDWLNVFVEGVTSYLLDCGITEDDLRTVLEVNLGVKPRVARVTVQRLTAIRAVVRELAPVGVEAEAEVVESPEEPAEAVESPEEPAQAEAEA